MQVSFDNLDRQTLVDEASFVAAQQVLVNAFKRSPNMMIRQRHQSQHLATRWLGWCRSTLTPSHLSSCSDSQLASAYERYQKYYESYSEENVFYWMVAADVYLAYCRRQLTEFKDNTDQTFETLTTSSEPSYVQRERIAFAKVRLVAVGHSAAQLRLALLRHSKKFGWVAWDYVGPQYWTVERLVRRLKQLNFLTARKLIGDDQQQRRELRQAQQAIEANFTQRLRSLFVAAREQAMLQDDKKAVTTESHYWLHFLHAEVADRLHVRRSELYFLSFEEISNVLLHRGVMPDASERSESGVVLIQRGQVEVVSGEDARRWRRTFVQSKRQSAGALRGISASRGVCRGRVVVVLTQQDAKKVKRGDILVTQMTTPEFVHAMERAAAFVTDEGGLTSHAAIVARELKKPCVIGTKVATKVFKDGDRVEVDATKGTVRKV